MLMGQLLPVSDEQFFFYVLFPLGQGVLFVSSYSGLVEVPVANCSNHQSCGECILSRDPYCGWTGVQCVDVRQASSKRLVLLVHAKK